MAAQSSRGLQVPAAIGLLLLGAIVAAGGASQFRILERTHQLDEILFSTSPRTLQAWMKTLNWSDPDSANLLAKRFLAMTLPQRRDAVIAMAGRAFFAALDKGPAGQRDLQKMVLQGVLAALRQAPVLGDLWFLAGRLHSQLYGIDTTAQRYLELSYLYAPREVDLVLARLEAMGLAWALLSETSRDIVRQDMTVASKAYPGRADELRSFLQRSGAKL